MKLLQSSTTSITPLANRISFGPLQDGVYIKVGFGCGFFVPELAFQAAQDTANTTRRVQFLGVTKDGEPLTGRREDILNHPNSAGVCAWITPK